MSVNEREGIPVNDSGSGASAHTASPMSTIRFPPLVLSTLLIVALLASLMTPRYTMAAECLISVDVELNDRRGFGRHQKIEALERIISLPPVGADCEVRIKIGTNEYRSRNCVVNGAPAWSVATGPASECEIPDEPEDAPEIGIANAPLFVVPAVPPALILAVDDSGSMDSEILVRSNDGAMWWNTNSDSFTGSGIDDQPQPGAHNFNLQGNANSTWKKYVYLFPNGTGLTSGRRGYSDSSHDHYAVPPIGAYAFARSPDYNFSYYSPGNRYYPWSNLGGYTFEDSNPDSAKTDPTRGNETFDLTSARERSDSNHVFRMYPGMTIPAGTRYRMDGTWVEAQKDIPIESVQGVAISYFPATFFLSNDNPLPEGYGYLPERGNIGGVIGNDAIIDGVAPDGTPMIRYEIRPENFVDVAHYGRAIQNFANWFTYYRKRHIATRGAIGEGFEGIDGFRTGAYRINGLPNQASSLPIRDLSLGADRDEFFQEIYHDFINTGGTPNREAVNHMRSQFSRTDDNAPIQSECQMNFGLLFTDGYANTWTGAGVGNRDGGMGAPFADDASNTMADIAMALYLDNPRPDLPQGLVPVPTGCNSANPDPRLDCNKNLHVNMFGLNMGAPGTIFKLDQDATEDPFANPPNWPTSFTNRNPVHVDDLWHATINSRGSLIDVEQPSELGAQFSEILDAIAARLDSSANSAAASSAVLQSDTLLYTAGFRSGDWSGTLTAQQINSDGSLEPIDCDACWDAEARLRAKTPASRRIFTLNGDSDAISFTWDALDDDQQDALNHGADDNEDDLGAARVAWLRGTEHASLRNRSESGYLRPLGDFIHSDPKFKDNVLYLGANDGMLHAFDAITGEELFAYIPSELLSPQPGSNHSLFSRLTDPAYSHRYFLDGTATVTDVRIDGVAKTYLVGDMGAGGRTVFALDVTDPQDFTTEDVKWEFTHPDLGFKPGTASIVRLNDDDGTWVAVFGNGYNSQTGTASLFVVDLEDGSLIKKIETNEQTPNGLAAAFITDWPERDLRARRIYAGDLMGNLWVFDISSGSNPNQWSSRILFTAEDADGDRQPITSRPYGARFDSNHSIITFGTGSYFRDQDGSDDQTQSFYGILDEANPGNNPTPVSRSGNDLLQQEITAEIIPGANETGEGMTLRLVSNNPIDSQVHKGWYMDLPGPGERVVNGPRTLGLIEQRVRFTTLIPDEDPCGTGRRGFLMDVNLLSGGRVETPVFDLNGDFEFDAEDMVADEFGSKETPSGIGFGTGESPVVVDVRTSGASASQDYQLICDGQGNCETARPSDINVGRQSWRQIQ